MVSPVTANVVMANVVAGSIVVGSADVEGIVTGKGTINITLENITLSRAVVF